MLFALYNILATLFWPLMWLYPPFRGTIPRRLGRFELGGYDPDKPGLKFLVNAVSAGEVVAISSLLAEIKRVAPDSQTALLTTTQSGQEMARTKAAGMFELLAFFPLVDLHFVVRRYLDRLKPDIYITTESELWPNIQAQCRSRGIPVVLANGRIYLHNKQGWRGSLVRRLYDQVDLLICQDELQKSRFIQFGIEEPRLAVSGNTKFDFEIPGWTAQQLEDWRGKWGSGGAFTLVAGSTHEGEEKLLLDAFAEIRRRLPEKQLKLVLAPRHIDRTAAVLELATQSGFRAASMATVEVGPGTDWDVLVVDRYGVLVDMYRLADLVIMGGTFHPKVGGHNLLEATALGKPVVVGPHTFSIVAQQEMLRNANALLETDKTEPPNLGEFLAGVVGDLQQLKSTGQRGLEVTLANRGAARRAVELILGQVRK